MAVLAILAGPIAAQSTCPGDCDGNGAVTVDELIVGVGIALETRPTSDCPSFDLNGDGSVSIDELIVAVNSALGECPQPAATPTPTQVSVASATATTSPTPEPIPTWTTAFDASQVGWMLNVWGPGGGTVWAVGGTNTHGRIFERVDGAWSEVDSGIEVPLLNWVHGTSATDVFIGGNGGTMLHFDGNRWSQQSTPVSAPVWGVFAVAANDVWAVGGDPGATDPPFVLHYDGEAWTSATLPILQRPRVYAFFKVWASGPDDVYIVGQNGIILHYDGSQFTELGIGVSQDLIGIWGTGPDNIMVVGGRGTAELAHFDGVQWHHVSSALPGLNGVWMRRPDVAHAVGIAGTILRVDPNTLEATEETSPPTLLDLHSVFGDDSGQLVALGGNFFTPERGIVLTRRMTNED
ncbi:MAG TPA: hypothetical protein VMT89_14465 [Candidatus Acidoferrales bacterium]|nr:hypothetical protein [Candidatus Acidoferrales bacterium]